MNLNMDTFTKDKYKNTYLIFIRGSYIDMQEEFFQDFCLYIAKELFRESEENGKEN